MAYAFNDDPVRILIGRRLPPEIIEHVKAGGKVVAHNAAFEWHIWNNVMRPRWNWPVLKVSQLECTMARAYAMAMPGSLKMLAEALGVSSRKDMGGHALMMKMAKPRKIHDDGRIEWWEDADKLEQLYAYCKRDVEVERECDQLLLPLSEQEQALWQLDLRINARGIRVDNPAIKATQRSVERVMKRMDAAMHTATRGEVKKVSEAKRTLEWCKARGVEIENLKKHEIKDWLDDPELPYEVREVLEIRSNSAKISVAKIETMKDMSLADGRIRGQFQYHGAATGRWAGRGVQVHNLPRPEGDWEDPKFQDDLLTSLTTGVIDHDFIEVWYGPFMRVVSSCVRGYLIAEEGKELIGADLKSIEGVTLPWLAGEEWKLEVFRNHFWNDGEGVYQLAASKIFGQPVAACGKGSEYYLLGKVGELSCGYQGGKGAFQQMATNYGVKVPDEVADGVKTGWREAHPITVGYWYDCERAAIAAVKNPGGKYYAGAKGRQVCFRVVGEYLWCQLPSGRCLAYPYPLLQMVPTFWGEDKLAVTFMGTDSRVGSKTKGKWTRLSTYGGKLVENITQATARDILAEAMPRVEAAGYPIILHVHDEIVAEVPKGFGSVEEIENIMSIVPKWATDLPIAADGFRGRRYRK